MVIPKAKFIELSSADPDAYGLPRNVGIKLNDKDFRYLTKTYLSRKLKEETGWFSASSHRSVAEIHSRCYM